MLLPQCFWGQGEEVFKTLHVCGKSPGRPSIAMVVGHKTNLLYAHDLKSGCHFLADTGAEVSMFPATRMDRNSHFQGTKLTAANGSNICTYGEYNISLIFCKQHFRWTFTIAQVSQPLLGAHLLWAHSILIDIKGQCLIDPFDFTSLTLRSITIVTTYLGSIASADDEFANLLAVFQMSQCLHSPTHPLSTEWSYSSTQMGYPFMHEHIGYLRTNCNWPG